jgi:hypothetical protein
MNFNVSHVYLIQIVLPPFYSLGNRSEMMLLKPNTPSRLRPGPEDSTVEVQREMKIRNKLQLN